jgi:hypothetical protein
LYRKQGIYYIFYKEEEVLLPVFGLGSAFAQIAPVGFFAIIFSQSQPQQPTHACLGDVAAMACPWGSRDFEVTFSYRELFKAVLLIHFL